MDSEQLHGTLSAARESVALLSVVYLFLIFYIFLAYHVVIDVHFIPALYMLQTKWKISDDMAGATLMAAGGCAPELFTNLMGTLVIKGGVGTGTVVGSLIFNMLVIPAAAAIASWRTLDLHWQVLQRDLCFFVASVGLLLWSLSKNQVKKT